MNISVTLHRSIILSETTIEDIEMTASDFVRRDDDHRLALAAMHAELTQAIDAAEEAARAQDEPHLRSVSEMLKSPAIRQKLVQALDTAGQGSQ